MKVLRWIFVIVLVAVAAAFLIIFLPKIVEFGRRCCGRCASDEQPPLNADGFAA